MRCTIDAVNSILLFLGVIATVLCLTWCYYEYFLDLDFSLVDHKDYDEDEDYPVPAISLCFSDPFIETNLQKFDPNITSLDYKNFLEGKIWNETMLEIDFESVTKNLDNYIEGYSVYWENSTAVTFFDVHSMKPPYKKPYLSFVGFNFDILLKCYTAEIPVNVSNLLIKIRTDIFPNGLRQNFIGYSFMMHYPNQLLNSIDAMKNDWPNRQNKPNDSYFMLFKVRAVEVMVRRNTRNKRCNENWKNDDFEAFKQLLSESKCKTPYHHWHTSYPYCNSREKMAMVNLNWTRRRQFHPPCQHVEKVLFDFEEYDQEELETSGVNIASPDFTKLTMLNSTNATTFATNLALNSFKFKVIIHKKAYDLQTLVGNCGGYVGLILGKFLHVSELRVILLHKHEW